MSGWTPQATTSYEYAPIIWWKPWTWFRLVGSTTVTESPWNIEQVDLLLAIAAFDASLDSNGIPFEDATSDAANPTNYPAPGVEAVRFIPHGPFINWAEKSRLDAEAAHRKELGENGNMNGVFFTVEKKTYAAIDGSGSTPSQ